MWIYWRLFLIALRLTGRRRRDLVLENLVLRQQLAVWERTGRHPTLAAADRRFWSVTARHWRGWRRHVQLVQPSTVVGWHRTAWRRYWGWKSRGRPRGRPRIDPIIRCLIVRIGAENPTWGVRRIAAELAVLGHPVRAATVQRYRGDRPPSPSWRTFLRLHASEIWAADFFTVQTLPFRTCYVFVLISHDRRRLVHWNVTRHPTQGWVWQQIREATPWGVHPRFLLRDRDRCDGGDFVRRAAAMGITTVLSPVRAPQANAIAERVIGTLRRDCLDHVLVLSERHLRHVLQEYVAYDNTTRPHQSLGDEPPDGPRHAHRPPGPVRLTSRPILGGLHHEYAWQAAGRSFETPQPPIDPHRRASAWRLRRSKHLGNADRLPRHHSSAASRILVAEPIFEALRDRLVDAARSLRVGPADAPDTRINPVIDREAHERLRRDADTARAECEVLLDTFDTPTGDLTAGPLIVQLPADRALEARTTTEELFGPIVALIPFRTAAEAYAVTNGTAYGLTAGVFSRSPLTIAEATRALQAGNVYVNRRTRGARVGVEPFGGMRMSGTGPKAGGLDYLWARICRVAYIA